MQYVVYESDLKFKSKRDIDPSRAIWYDENVKNNYYNKNFDTIKYRFEECEKNDFVYLDLSHLDLCVFPSNIPPNIKKIKFLFLNNNQLRVLGRELDVFDRLEVIDISDNKLTKITWLPPTLIELVCAKNRLIELPSHKNLQKLDCGSNQLEQLPIYPQLFDLMCDNNKLKELFVYQKVNRIICSNNPIVMIHPQPQLTHLDASSTHISGCFVANPTIKRIILNNTIVSSIDGMESLETLEICQTRIKKIYYMSKLKDLVFCSQQEIKLDSDYKIRRIWSEHDISHIEFVV